MAHGGVSARIGGCALAGGTGVAAAPTAGAQPNFVSHGGPVIATPRVFASFWGPSWQSDAQTQSAAARLQLFCTDLLASTFMNVIAQYGVGSGTFVAASDVTQVAAQLDDAGVRAAIQGMLDAGTLPEPPANNTSDALIVFLDESIEIDDTAEGLVMCEPSGDTAFGYHNFFTTAKGNTLYYAIIPALDDACVRESCPGGDGSCSLQLTQTQEQRRTQVVSHEFAEMTTDPQLNAWYDQQNGENGDICNGQTDTITVGADSWNVQRIYSKYDDVRTNGDTYCVSGAPSPLPPV